MISFEQARDTVWKKASEKQLDIETVPLAESVNRICAENIKAPLSIQPFDNAAMDGFAVCRSGLEKASPDTPLTLKSMGIIAAGDILPDQPLKAGYCFQIMTGAPVPKGCDAVVPVELVERVEDEITFTGYPEKNANIRFAGEDFKKGEMVLSAGQRITANCLLALATVGIAEVRVYKKPKVALITTGLELVDDLSKPLKGAEIYNSNKVYAQIFLEQWGCDVCVFDTVHDDVDVFKKHMADIAEQDFDIVVSSGAVSAGVFDFVGDSLKAADADILFHKIKLKPGKPNLFAVLPDGALYFGLPGNPVATAAGLRFFVVQALRVMTGQPPEEAHTVPVTTPFSKKAGMHMLLKGIRKDTGVEIMSGQASFMVSPFTTMNTWVSVPDDVESIDIGDSVDIYPLTDSP